MYCTAQGIQPQLVITVNGKYPLKIVQRFLGGTVNENPPANAGDMDSIPGWEDSTYCKEPLSLL